MEKQYAIMFADVAGSTSLYEKLGDDIAEQIIGNCLSNLSNISKIHNGTTIKTIGDEVMISFDDATDAADAAIEMQRSTEHNTSDTTHRLSIRIGVSYGDAILKNSDLFGDAVNTAARMAGIAKARQIIATEKLIKALNETTRSTARLFDTTKVKGKDEELNIYQLVWENDGNVTKFATSHEIKKITSSTQAIVFKFNGQEKLYTSDDLSTSIAIGKDPSCDLSLEARYASRTHANLEFRRGKFVLNDHSTNGTYVAFKDQETIFIKREDITLFGEGFISLGETIEPDSTSNISFSVLQSG